MTKTLPLPRPRQSASEDEALAFAQAYHRWLQISQEPRAWTEPDRQRALAAAFLRFHAAKLALSETAAACPQARPAHTRVSPVARDRDA